MKIAKHKIKLLQSLIRAKWGWLAEANKQTKVSKLAGGEAHYPNKISRKGSRVITQILRTMPGLVLRKVTNLLSMANGGVIMYLNWEDEVKYFLKHKLVVKKAECGSQGIVAQYTATPKAVRLMRRWFEIMENA